MNTAMVRMWALQNVFFLWLASPKILELTDERCVIRVPLNWRTRRRDIHAMYLGTLCMGADVAAGLIAFKLVQERKLRVNFLFKDMNAEFLKRAEGDVHFTNNEGRMIQEMLQRALETGERQEATVPVIATVPSKFGEEPVARFTLTLSLKKKS
jgi:acyl-coenzyme A thioesterase PaaI-like protein